MQLFSSGCVFIVNGITITQPQSKATERFEIQPGQQAQENWGHFRVEQDGGFKRLFAFVMVLGYSRTMYVEYTEDERLETLMGCHTRAFEYFGGIKQTCLYDNMKTVVAGHDENGEVIWTSASHGSPSITASSSDVASLIGRGLRERSRTASVICERTSGHEYAHSADCRI